ncbi:MAG: hypothetical protein B7Y49_04195 [Sphingomonas sp. 28-62-11]|nr:MAG: hypothetical protein B7Y49_04195 [Sphingomonas sp. 28-62-11]
MRLTLDATPPRVTDPAFTLVLEMAGDQSGSVAFERMADHVADHLFVRAKDRNRPAARHPFVRS